MTWTCALALREIPALEIWDAQGESFSLQPAYSRVRSGHIGLNGPIDLQSDSASDLESTGEKQLCHSLQS